MIERMSGLFVVPVSAVMARAAFMRHLESTSHRQKLFVALSQPLYLDAFQCYLLFSLRPHFRSLPMSETLPKTL